MSKDAGPSPAVLIALFALTVAVTAVGLRLGAIGYASDLEAQSESVLAVSQLLLQGSGVGGLVVLATALTAFATNSPRLRRLMLILVPLQVGVGFLVGFKGASLIPIVYVVLAYIAVRGRIPWKTIGIVSLVTVLVLVPANLVYRYAVRTPQGAAALTPSSTAEVTQRIAGSRFRLIDHVALIHERTPSMYPFANGSSYALLPVLIVVPRALWPEKPILAYGEEFSHTYWEIPRILRTSTPPTQIGDLYRNFRAGGALLGIAIWGLVIGGFTALRRRIPSFRMEMVYLASLATWITSVEAYLPQLIAAMSRTLPVTVAVAWLLMPGRNRPPGYRRVRAALVRRSGFLARAIRSPSSLSDGAPST